MIVRNRLVANEYYTCYEGVPLSQGARTAFDGGEDVFRRVGEGFSFIFSGRYVYFWRPLKIFTAPAKNELGSRQKPFFILWGVSVCRYARRTAFFVLYIYK